MPKLHPQPKPFQLDGTPKLLSKKQVLSLLGISANSLWRWTRSGRFPRAKVLSNQMVRWDSREVEAFIAALPSQRLKPPERSGD
jgi:predicted DNA-binding transcriptional regulator AlpA